MKKVTVKHYLNTNIVMRELNPSNGEYLNDKILHPVYVQISFARRTTQIRSYTEILLTDEDYEYYKCGNYEKMTNTEKIKTHLVPEPQRIKAAIEYLLKRSENNINKNDILLDRTVNKFDDIRYDVEHLMEPMEYKLVEYSWNFMAICSERWLQEADSIDIHDVFNLNKNLLDNLDIIKRITDYDLTPFFSHKEIVFWENINFLIKKYEKEDYSFIDFVNNYDSLIKATNEIKDKNVFITEMKALIDYET